MMRSEGDDLRVHLEREMDTSTVEISKNTSAGSGKRRMRTLEEKRRIVEEVLRGEESVACWGNSCLSSSGGGARVWNEV